MDSKEQKEQEKDHKENSDHNQEQESDKKQMDEQTQKEIQEDLKRVMEELKKQQNQKGQKRRIFAIEFGGVYHHNKIINFLFSYLFNATLIFSILEVLPYAEYDNLLTLMGVVLAFTLIESGFRMYIFSQHFKLILQSFGTVFYFGYVLIFYLIDQFVMNDSFRFINELVLVYFVLIFSILRYGFGLLIRRFIRHGWKQV